MRFQIWDLVLKETKHPKRSKKSQFSPKSQILPFQQDAKLSNISWIDSTIYCWSMYFCKGLSIYYVIRDGGAGVFPIYYNISFERKMEGYIFFSFD